ncbi:MAG: hypothetical protein IV090_00990 [Candidatus Sericytochromatia bacterium]|nr:hypothetical protein [Candidatus Sericytochromatia bacterium]
MLLPTRRNFAFFNMLLWQWKSVLFFAVVATAAWLFYFFENLDLLLPSLSLSVLGSALGIFVSFRTNSAYQRWWEARQLWGGLVNSSRHFATQVMGYLPQAPESLREELLRRQIGYVHTLRCVLRDQDPFADADVSRHLGEELIGLKGQQNPCQALLAWNFQSLAELKQTGQLDAWQMQDFDLTLRQILEVQGGCERIKRTPMPPAYGLLATRLIQVFGVLLPLSLVHEIGWRIIPINVFLCIAFTMVNELGRVLEDPFTLSFNGLPLMVLSRTIEVNLLQSLGRSDLPEIPGPSPPGVLM